MRSNGHGRLPSTLPTLATLLSAQGYRTGAFLSSAVLDQRHGLDRGFDLYQDQVGPTGERSAEDTVDRALAWLRQDRSRPAFLWVHLFDAHAPYRPPAPFREAFPGQPYNGELAYVDSQLGRVLDAFRQPGRDTVVSVIGDHGEGLGDHGEKEHGLLLYQTTLAVPWVLVAAGSQAGERVAQPVRTVDMLPTLLGRLGMDPPPGLDGRDVLRAADSPPPPHYAETLLPYEDYGWQPLFTLRDGNLKLHQGGYDALYDLGEDSGEEDDLLAGGDPSGPVKAGYRQLAGALQAHRLQTAGVSEDPAQDPDTLERLRSLGYLAGGGWMATEKADSALPDPRLQTDFHDRVTRILAAYRDRDFDKATRILDTVLQDQPGNPFLLDLSGSLAMARQQPQAAAARFEAALRHVPQRGAVRLHLAEALLAAGQPVRAAAEARRARLDLPSPPPERLALVLCQALASQGDRPGADACARDFLSLLEFQEPSRRRLLEELLGPADAR